MAVYAASKAFVLNFTEALSAELSATDVRVLAVSPGPTRSGFYAASGTDERGVRFQSPEQVVDVALSALGARRTPASVVSGRANRAQVTVGRLLPRGLVLRLASRSVRASADVT
jgi:short-subunit dehydrogenase